MEVMLFGGGLFAGIGSLFTIIGVVIFFNLDSMEIQGDGPAFLLPLIFTGLGLICAFVGFFMLAGTIKDRRREKRLIAQGNFVWAEVVDIYEDWSVQMNGSPGLRVVLTWEDPTTRVVYQFNSNPVFRGVPQFPEGYQLKVYVDRNDYTNYAVVLKEGRPGVPRVSH